MEIGEYTLVNQEKLDRAINGTVGAEGRPRGGVGADASEEAILAEYDRLAGLIRYQGYKVKTGCFYDFDGKKPFEDPEPMLEFKIDGETIEVAVGEALPMEVRATEEAKKRKAAKKAEKDAAKADKKAASKKGKGKKNAVKESDEEEDTEKDAEDTEEGDLA